MQNQIKVLNNTGPRKGSRAKRLCTPRSQEGNCRNTKLVQSLENVGKIHKQPANNASKAKLLH